MIPIFSAALSHAGQDFRAAVQRVLDSNWFLLGQELTAFEQEFAASLGVGCCVGVANGTDALELALRAVGVAPGDTVVAAANAGFYGSAAIRAIGAEPLYADVDPVSLTLAPQALEAALAAQPRAVIVTHLYGQLADVEALAALCRSAGAALVEDCAQAHGASRGGRRAGSFGDVSCFSFYPTKNLGALGDAGAVATNDPALAERVRSLRQYGWTAKYTVSAPGGRNSRMDEIQAAVLRQKLPGLDAANAARRAIAGRYNAAFRDLPLTLPPSLGEDYAAHLYVVRTPRRDELAGHLRADGVGSAVHYPVPDHRQPAWPGARTCGPLPVTEAACASVLSLPCFPGLPQDDVDRVVAAVRAFFQR